jgi:hypothetical protein
VAESLRSSPRMGLMGLLQKPLRGWQAQEGHVALQVYRVALKAEHCEVEVCFFPSGPLWEQYNFNCFISSAFPCMMQTSCWWKALPMGRTPASSGDLGRTERGSCTEGPGCWHVSPSLPEQSQGDYTAVLECDRAWPLCSRTTTF